MKDSQRQIKTHSACDLRTEYLVNPIGIDVPVPRFSWKMESERKNIMQSAYRITVRQENTVLWDSGSVESPVSIQIPYGGPAFLPRTRYDVEVQTWDEKHVAGCPAHGHFETGWGTRKWPGTWIQGIAGENGNPVLYDNTLRPVLFFRREFALKNGLKRARLYITSLGIFQSIINGHSVSDECFSPGWTDYFNRVIVRTYDVTSMLHKGKNAIALQLAEGWYSGRISNNWNGGKPTYGDTPKIRAVLACDYADGTSYFLPTDDTWMFTSAGPLRYSDIYDGEAYDCRFDLGEYASADYPACGWQQAIATGTNLEMQSIPYQPVRRIDELPPVNVIRKNNGVMLVDFGQNLTGRERLSLSPARGAFVRIRHGEMCTADGNLYTDNLRTAKAQTIFVGDGKPHIYEPHFTFYGFRYLELSGDLTGLIPEQIRAIVLHTDMERTGFFECSNPKLNQLFNNIIWSQRDNYLDIPTDCPQRDERLGWTGDSLAFINAASYNFRIAAFYTKYLQDLELCRNEFGEYPPYSPYPYSHTNYDGQFGMAGWEDAVYVCTAEIYRKYSDVHLLEMHYPAMADTLRRKLAEYPSCICDQACFGDWLNIGAPLPPEFLGTAFMAHAAELMAGFARILGKTVEHHEFLQIHERIKKAFQHIFLDGQGRLKATWEGTKRSFDAGDSFGIPLSCRTQTGAVLALHFNLLPELSRKVVLKDLLHDIKKHDFHLTTGFIGTPLLVQELVRQGCVSEAYRLLEQESYPSWLFSVCQGATTVWERWNSYSREDGFGKIEMNSFNHYAYGAIADFLYETVGGIIPEQPGFQNFAIAPKCGGTLTDASVQYDSEYGLISSAWHLHKGIFRLDITVPPNTHCTVHLPDGAVFHVGSGKYRYKCAL